MKLIAVTQRVMIIPEYQERRDSLDQRWPLILNACRCISYPIPNQPTLLKTFLNFPFDGIILTGGNSLNEDVPERDQVEIAILEYALRNAIPLLGVCRGMQLILRYFGSKLEKVQDHAAKSHIIFLDGEEALVNSYHDYGAFQALYPLRVIAKANDGVIEAVEHESLPVYGIMWHPERNAYFNPLDIELLCKIFTKRQL